MAASSPATPDSEGSGQLTGIGASLGILARFVVCGLLSLAGGAAWRLTLAPRAVGVGSALLGVLCLLAGFVLGGIGWYLLDARRRSRNPESVSDERIIFSFIVFVLVPLAVGVVVGLIWVLAQLV